jgi:hypothetical protein
MQPGFNKPGGVGKVTNVTIGGSEGPLYSVQYDINVGSEDNITEDIMKPFTPCPIRESRTAALKSPEDGKTFQ